MAILSSPPRFLLGIDLGGTKIEIIALDEWAREQYRKRRPTPTHKDQHIQYQQIISTIELLVQDCEKTLGQSNLPLGVGLPGAISLKTGLVKNANTTCLIGRDFKADLHRQLKRPMALENDANCFALSEAKGGAGKGFNNVFAVILGTGVGGGVVINQQLLVGANAICGEWGHNPLPWQDNTDLPLQTCYCGKKGCIETFLSGPGMRNQNNLQYGLALNSRQIIEKMHTQPQAMHAYEAYLERLAKSLASIINVLDPEVIVLGGGLSNIDSLYTDVPKRWGKYVFSDEVNTRLVKNTFGDSSGVRGAAYLTENM
jgi:fructokinase